MKAIYTIFGILVVLGYAYAEVRGLELRPSRRRVAPQSLRSSQPGYRSFWYAGYHGGK